MPKEFQSNRQKKHAKQKSVEDIRAKRKDVLEHIYALFAEGAAWKQTDPKALTLDAAVKVDSKQLLLKDFSSLMRVNSI